MFADGFAEGLMLLGVTNRFLKRSQRHLQRMDPQKATPMLTKALLAQLEQGQAKAAWVLGRLGDRALRPDLERYAGSPEKAVAELSKQALAKLGHERSLAEIVAELHADDEVISKVT
jgi:HEAT repeat protein